MAKGATIHSTLVLLALSTFMTLLLNLGPLSAMTLPPWLSLTIALLRFGGVLGVQAGLRYTIAVGWLGLALFFIVGVISAYPLEEDAHRWARHGLSPPAIASSGAIYARLIVVSLISSLWRVYYYRLIKRR